MQHGSPSGQGCPDAPVHRQEPTVPGSLALREKTDDLARAAETEEADDRGRVGRVAPERDRAETLEGPRLGPSAEDLGRGEEADGAGDRGEDEERVEVRGVLGHDDDTAFLREGL